MEPRFLMINNKPYLISATFDKGQITSLDGPYQAIGSEGMKPEEFVREFTQIMLKALHASSPLQIEDLPEEAQKVVHAALAKQDKPELKPVK